MEKEIRMTYIAAKIGLLALAAAFTIGGLQALLTDGSHATTAVCLWLGGMMANGCVGLEV